MPLAWFSEAECKVYHFCLNCQYDRFDFDTFHIGQEEDILEGENLRPCARCELLSTDRERDCWATECYSKVWDSITQYGKRRNLVVKRYVRPRLKD